MQSFKELGNRGVELSEKRDNITDAQVLRQKSKGALQKQCFPFPKLSGYRPRGKGARSNSLVVPYPKIAMQAQLEVLQGSNFKRGPISCTGVGPTHSC